MVKELTMLLLFILSIYLIGGSLFLLLSRSILRKSNVFLNLAYSWGLGSFIMIFFLHIVAITNKLSLITQNFLYGTLVISLVVFGGLFYWVRQKIGKTTLIHGAVLMFFILFFLPLIKDALFSYLIGWDATAIWMLKAKSFFFSDGFWNNSFFTYHEAYPYAHKAYPVGIPLLVAAYYRLIGWVNDQFAQLLFLMFYLNVVFLFLGSLRKVFEKRNIFIIILLTLSVMILPHFVIYSHNGYVDMAMSFAVLAVTVALLFLYKAKEVAEKRSYAFLLLFAGGFAATIKNEGYILFGISIFIFLYVLLKISRNMKDRLLMIVPVIIAAIPFGLWMYSKNILNAEADSYLVGAGISLGTVKKLKTIMNYYMDEMINVSHYNIMLIPSFLLYIFQMTLLTYGRKFVVMVPSIVILLQLAFYTAVYAVTALPLEWQVPSSFDRLLMHLLPAFFFILLYQMQPAMNMLEGYFKKR